MRNRILIIVIAITLGIFFSCNEKEEEIEDYLDYEKDLEQLNACINMPRPEDSYDYPVRPGMGKWKEFKSTDEMIAACQVPLSVLERLSTQAVIQACWEYPFFPEIAFRPYRFQKDFNTIFLTNNAYKELLLRTNAGQCLFERFLLLDPFCSGHSIHPTAFLVFMSQATFLSQIDFTDKVHIVQKAFINDNLKQTAPEYAGSVSREYSWILIGRIMQNAGYEPFLEELSINDALRLYLEEGELHVSSQKEYDDFMNNIISYGKDFISQYL